MLTLRRFLGVVVLDIFMSLPLLFGLADVMSSFLSKNALSPLAFVSMVFGFIFLCSPMLIACALQLPQINL